MTEAQRQGGWEQVVACPGAPAPGKEEGPSTQVGSGPSTLAQFHGVLGKSPQRGVGMEK